MRPLVVVWLVGFLAVPVTAPGQVTCRPNIFGGQDCEGPEGRSSSRPNIFGGYDTEGPGKGRSSPSTIGAVRIESGRRHTAGLKMPLLTRQRHAAAFEVEARDQQAPWDSVGVDLAQPGKNREGARSDALVGGLSRD